MGIFFYFNLFVCFITVRPQLAVKVMSKWSVILTTVLFIYLFIYLSEIFRQHTHTFNTENKIIIINIYTRQRICFTVISDNFSR